MKSAKDSIEAHQHAILCRLGMMDKNAAHPGAAALAHAELLPSLQAQCAAAQAEARRTGVQALGLGTFDLPHALAETMRVVVRQTFVSNLDHARIAAEVPVKNFLPTKIISGEVFDTRLVLAHENGEFAEVTAIDDSLAGQAFALRTFGKTLSVSDRVIKNDDLSLVADAVRQFAVSAARREAESLYAVLQLNPVLADGNQMFSASAQNLLAGGATDANLTAAIAALRGLRKFGEPRNLAAKFIVCSPTNERPVRRFLRDNGFDTFVETLVTPYITHSFVLPDPEEAPVLGLMRLAGAVSPVDITAENPRGDKAFVLAATRLRCRFDMTAVPLSRSAVMIAA